MFSTASRACKALRLKFEMTGTQVGMCLIRGKKSTRVAAGEPDSTVRVAALSAGERASNTRTRERRKTDRA